MDSYKDSSESQYTLGEATVIFLSKSQDEYPNLVITEDIHSSKVYPIYIQGKECHNMRIENSNRYCEIEYYNVNFKVENFRETTINLGFSINLADETIQWGYEKDQVAGWLLKDLHYYLDRNDISDILLEQFLSEYFYKYNTRFTND